MFLDLDKKDRAAVAVIDDSGAQLTYGEICDFSAEFAARLPARSLIFLLAENRIGSLLGYTACLSERIVPLILSAKTETGLYERLRIGLDEVENLVKAEFQADCYCKGDDERLVVLVTNPALVDRLPAFVEEKTHLFHKNIEVRLVDKILRNEAGKVINQ